MHFYRALRFDEKATTATLPPIGFPYHCNEGVGISMDKGMSRHMLVQQACILWKR